MSEVFCFGVLCCEIYLFTLIIQEQCIIGKSSYRTVTFSYKNQLNYKTTIFFIVFRHFPLIGSDRDRPVINKLIPPHGHHAESG